MTKSLLSNEIKRESDTEGNFASADHLFHLSSSPHLRHTQTVPMTMKNVIIGLLPATLAAILIFRIEAIMLISISVITALITEWLYCLLSKRGSSLTDFSAVVTSLLFALSLPPYIPWWMAVIGSVFAISIVKMLFGGLGSNFVNPALAARAFLMISFPAAMFTSWKTPAWGTISGVDSLSTATPLAYFRNVLQSGTVDTSYLQSSILHLFIGNVGGSIGETSAFALLIGALWLWYKKIISLKIPLSFVGSFFLLVWTFNGTGEFFTINALLIPVFQIMAGGLMLGALFMANDTVTSPITPLGKILFGLGCGILTFVFRKYLIFSDGLCYAILLMNLSVPILEHYTKPKRSIKRA